MPAADTNNNREPIPWYKQFWPWFLIAIPAATVIACFVTIYLAAANPDRLLPHTHSGRFGTVAEDKQ